jgi:putative flippase GtrA
MVAGDGVPVLSASDFAYHWTCPESGRLVTLTTDTMDDHAGQRALRLKAGDEYSEQLSSRSPGDRIVQVLEMVPGADSMPGIPASTQAGCARPGTPDIRNKWSLMSERVFVLARPAIDAARRSLARFLLVGASGLVVNSLALTALYGGVKLPLLLASPLSVELAITSNFVLNDRWTFGRRRPTLRRFARFNLTMLGVMLITSGTVWLLVERLHVQYLLANVLSIGAATLLNFTISTAWIWGRKS